MKSFLLVKINGLNIDNLLLKIYSNNIYIKNVKRQNHSIVQFEISEKDYNKIKKYLTDYECKIEPIGAKKLKQYLLLNVAVLLAVPFVLGLAYFASLFIWKIEVSGLQEVSIKSVNQILQSNKVKKGALKIKNETDIETCLLNSGLFAQVSCYYRGTTLMINVSEKLVYETNEFLPLKAKHSGIITSYEIIQGTTNLVVGEFVKAGDILVYPYMIDKEGNKINVEPKANIEGKIYVSETSTKMKNEVVLVPSGKVVKKSCLSFNGRKKTLLNSYKPFVFYETKVYNNYISSVLPIIRQTIVYFELIEQQKINDLNSCKQDVEQQSIALAQSKVEQPNSIIEQSTNSIVLDDILYSTTTIIYQGSILN